MASKQEAKTASFQQIRSLPGGVWALGFVSLFMDMSSEMIHSLLPVFLVTVLGASPVFVGLVEGLGEATTPITKLFSGWASDRIGRRKPFALFGYGLALLSKPIFAIAPTAVWVLMARFVDRIGKGIRGAPRDALVADLTPNTQRGAAYGLRQSLDSVGAFAGPLLALAFMELFHDDFRLVFWIAAVPAVACVLTLALLVRDPDRHHREPPARFPIQWSALGALGARFWTLSLVAIVLILARFSEAFLVLKAQRSGLSIALIPLVLVVMNVVYALSAYPVGAFSDRVDRRTVLIAGFAVLIMADLVLGSSRSIFMVMAGVALWGLHMGMTQGLFAALVADAVGEDHRGTAFGIFNFLSGMGLLAASLIAGFLWERVGPSATFYTGASLTTVGLVAAGLLLYGSKGRRHFN